MAKGWEREEVVNACDAAANGRDGSGDVATAAALLRMGRMGVVGAAALGSRKVCAAGCATAEGAVRAQGVYTRGPEACQGEAERLALRCRG